MPKYHVHIGANFYHSIGVTIEAQNEELAEAYGRFLANNPLAMKGEDWRYYISEDACDPWQISEVEASADEIGANDSRLKTSNVYKITVNKL